MSLPNPEQVEFNLLISRRTTPQLSKLWSSKDSAVTSVNPDDVIDTIVLLSHTALGSVVSSALNTPLVPELKFPQLSTTSKITTKSCPIGTSLRSIVSIELTVAGKRVPNGNPLISVNCMKALNWLG